MNSGQDTGRLAQLLQDLLRNGVDQSPRDGELKSVLERIAHRRDWLGRFGKLIEMCPAPENRSGRQAAFPFSLGNVKSLLKRFEADMPEVGTLDDSPQIMSYLLLKSVSLRADDAEASILLPLFQRWRQGASVINGDSERPIVAADSAVAHAQNLRYWLEQWDYKQCEHHVLEVLEGKGNVDDVQLVRLKKLRQDMPGVLHLPERSRVPSFYPIQKLEDNKVPKEKLRADILADHAAGRPLRSYVFRDVSKGSGRSQDRFPTTTDCAPEKLIEQLCGELSEKLKDYAQTVRPVRIAMDMGDYRLQPEKTWLEIIPRDADSFHVSGAKVWADVDVISSGDEKTVSWTTYRGVDPAGLELDVCLKLFAALREEDHTSKLAMAVDNAVKNFLMEQARWLYTPGPDAATESRRLV